MARWVLPDMSPWKRQPLAIPPDSARAWVTLAAWEIWLGTLVAGALVFGTQLIVTARSNIITVFDFTNCYAARVVQPCERVAYRTGQMTVVLNLWCGVLLIAVGVWLLWELWNATAPKPITDDFLKLLDQSFARDWRRPRTWPWARVAWSYGFTCAGAVAAVGITVLASRALSSSGFVRTPTAHVETSQRVRTYLAP
jgi:hypothetical protein